MSIIDQAHSYLVFLLLSYLWPGRLGICMHHSGDHWTVQGCYRRWRPMGDFGAW